MLIQFLLFISLLSVVQANPGSPGKMAVKTECVFLSYRVSIQHVNFHKPYRLTVSEHRSATADEREADASQEDDVRVYPISSEGGCVIYHVGCTSSMQSAEDLQSYSVPMPDTDRVYDDTVAKNCIDASSLDFPIDNFASRGSLDTNSTAHGKSTMASVSADSIVRRRHSDDGTVHVLNGTDNDCDDVTDSAESVVDKVISDIIDSVIRRCVNMDDVYSAEKNEDSRCDLTHKSSPNLADGEDYDNDDTSSEMYRCRYDSGDYPSDTSNVTSVANRSPTMHPLYAHILLYVRKFDTSRAIYALGRLRAILLTSPNVVVRALTTSNVGGTNTPRATLLQSLLVQHRRSVLGRRFSTDDTEANVSGIRSSMFIDVLVTICLYYMRGYYPNLLAPRLTAHDVADSARLQVSAADILTTVVDELAVIIRTGGRGFATYIFDLLDKCKVRCSAVVSSL